MELEEQSAELMEEYRKPEHRKNFIQKMALINNGKFKTSLFEQLVMGFVVAVTLNELAVQLLLKMSVEAGELPTYINDTVFLCISLLETLLAPLICWLGYSRVRITLSSWMLLNIASIVPLFFLTFDASKTTTGLCTIQVTPLITAGSSKPIIRLVMLVFMGISSSCARMSVLAHGVAVLDDHGPEVLMKRFGIFISARVAVLVMGKALIYQLLSTTTWLQLIALIAPMLIKCVLLLIVGDPRDNERELGIKRDFFSTLKRVAGNSHVMVHAVCLGFLTAGVWGFFLYNNAVLETKYHMVSSTTTSTNVDTILKLQYCLVMLVLVVTHAYAPSPDKEFDRDGAKKQTLKMSLMIIIIMIATALLNCKKTSNLWSPVYEQPACSVKCGCAADQLNSFNPVCLVDTMTTYYSPCHAGCSNQTEINGHTVLKNCQCGSYSGNVIMGACTNNECHDVYYLHQSLYIGVLAIAVTTILLHCMVIIRSVSATDKSTALGVVFSMSALLAFLCGHALFMGLSAWTCAYEQKGQCHLHQSSFGVLLGVISACLVATSAVINLVTTVMKRWKS